MNWVKNNRTIIGALIVAGVISAYAFLKSENKISDIDLLKMNDECAVRAEELAKRQSGTDSLGRAELKVIHSVYDTKRKSCFAEIDVAVKIEDSQSPYKDFSEWRIYDVIREDTINRWTYEGAEQWEQTNTLKEYEKLKKEIFGLDLYK